MCVHVCTCAVCCGVCVCVCVHVRACVCEGGRAGMISKGVITGILSCHISGD